MALSGAAAATLADGLLIHHGGRQTVTGSCHELRVGSDSLLIDCGLMQGDDAERTGGDATAEPDAIDFPVAQIRALLVTHVHIDHVGRVPWLLAAGFDGPIICSEASAALLPLVIEDAVKVGITRNPRLVQSMVQRVRERVVAVPFGVWHELPIATERVRAKFRPAGHIFGSSYIEVQIGRGRAGRRIVFSGDLGAPWAPLLPSPKPPYGADLLVLESTYGDALHPPRRNRRRELQNAIEHALRDEGTVLIPAFSLGRTQDLLYDIESIIHEVGPRSATGRGLPWEDLEVIVDSPLASRFTEVFREMRHLWDAEARRRVSGGRHPLSFDQLYTIDSHASHLNAVKYLASTGRPAIVIAASGMCTGGRIVNWLKAMIGDARNDVVFVGFQAAGTPGRDILTWGPRGGYVALDGQRYTIRAGIHRLSHYSAHADQAGLVRFARRMRRRPSAIRLVHGEADAQDSLRRELRAAIPGVIVD